MSLGFFTIPAGTIQFKSIPFKSTNGDATLHLKSPLVVGSSVKLGYEIAYPGYIEFYLFGPDGQKIWQNFGVQEKGEHYQSLKRSKLKEGATYSYEFWYKGKAYPGKFNT